MKVTECVKIMQGLLKSDYDISLSQNDISVILRLYRDLLLNELLNDMKTSIPGIGKIKCSKYKKRNVFGQKIKAHYCLKLVASDNLKKAINELHHVDQSK